MRGRSHPSSLYPSPTSPTNFSFFFSPLLLLLLFLAAALVIPPPPPPSPAGSRRRWHLKHGKNSLPVDFPKPIENENSVETAHPNIKPFSVHPLPLTKTSDVLPESSNGSDSLKEEKNQYYPGKEIKRRKRHRRKQYVDQEPCIMRGVYFKNMKWQAAIKVDKKQIHLGTVGTQEEAARLYDRAAFMCGREPNFELSEEEKKELQQYTWQDFLNLTRDTITSKKQRKVRNKADSPIGQSDGDTEMINGGGSSHSEDGDVETSTS
uniref:AP2/ERF domain-containing protein n=1 Tax=Leersia perrieri TaxID=77586 RepID=A0A0D9VG68_9ORYZ